MDVFGKQKTSPPAKSEGNNPPVKSITQMIEDLKPQLARALPKHVTPDRLARVALTAVRSNPKLGMADAMSLMGAIMTAAQLGLEPNTPLGQCYIIPYKDNKANRVDAQFQMGYKGLIDLAHRSAQYRQITAQKVDEADTFSFTLGLNMDLTHTPAAKPSGNITHYYAVYHLTNGGYNFTVWSREQVQAHAEKYSKTWDPKAKSFYFGSAWRDSFDSMAEKTVLIDLLRYAPKSVEMNTAVTTDNRTARFSPENESLDIEGDFELSDGEAE